VTANHALFPQAMIDGLSADLEKFADRLRGPDPSHLAFRNDVKIEPEKVPALQPPGQGWTRAQ